MNMNFQRPYGLELEPLPRHSALARAHRQPRKRPLRYALLAAVAASGALFVAVTAGATALLVIAGAAAVLLAALAAACVYVQNHALL